MGAKFFINLAMISFIKQMAVNISDNGKELIGVMNLVVRGFSLAVIYRYREIVWEYLSIFDKCLKESVWMDTGEGINIMLIRFASLTTGFRINSGYLNRLRQECPDTDPPFTIYMDMMYAKDIERVVMVCRNNLLYLFLFNCCFHLIKLCILLLTY